MQIKKLAKQIHANARRNGWWDKKRNEGEVLFLVVTELAEACEAHRKKKRNYDYWGIFEARLQASKKWVAQKHVIAGYKIELFEKDIKDSIGDELADAFIRMLDYCTAFKVDIKEKKITLRVKLLLENKKLKNFGEELLTISGQINFCRQTRTEKGHWATGVLARLIWLSQQMNIDLDKHVKWKMWYNTTRPRKHNKKY